MAANKNLPDSFRAMFKGTFLPFRDPQTLTLFLKEIDALPYRHSEDLGNAYEYLLSIMDTQGAAGQFRTPSHIIDFIVAVVDPQKNERVHDPACGTAGFLISAFRHIQKANTKNLPGDTLSPTEKRALTHNLNGCELDPGMVRLSLVNMYMHGIKQPQIRAYDTLTHDDLWDESYDVILANPPFMTPKGGIRPHSRFAVRAKRSEVLFVDYIAEHLSPRGRAGIIVPEGVIFQVQRAYKELRRLLLTDWGLWAVVSLPAGVFNPYSGVKTSVLLLDKLRAKKAKEILFVKVRADGFYLGAQRHPIPEDNLPEAQKVLSAWKDDKKLESSELALWAAKDKIAEDGEYNLTAERYQMAVDYSRAKWPMVKLREVAEIGAGNSAPQNKELFENGKYPFCRTSDVGAVHISDNFKEIKDFLNDKGIERLRLSKKDTILLPKSGASTFLNHRVMLAIDSYVSSHLATIYSDRRKMLPKFLFYLFLLVDAKKLTNNQDYPSLRLPEISKIKIPLPPLAVQEKIVAELDGYQRVIEGARLAIANWKPSIPINPDWPMVKLGDVCRINPRFSDSLIDNEEVSFVPMSAVGAGNGSIDLSIKRTYAEVKKGYTPFSSHDVIFAKITPCMENGKVAVIPPLTKKTVFGSTEFHVLRSRSELDSRFLYYIVSCDNFRQVAAENMTGTAGQKRVPASFLKNSEIPLPPLEVQQQIVAEIAKEERNIAACRCLIDLHEQKIRAKVATLWGE